MPMPNFKRNLLIFVCLAMFGCGDNGYEIIFSDYNVYGGGLENDSMVIFLEVVQDKWHTEGALGTGGGGYYTIREMSLNLADNRTEKIYWKKNIIHKDDYIHLHLNLTDSVLVFIRDEYGSNSKIAVLRLGDKKIQASEQIELKYKEINFIGKAWGGEEWGFLGYSLSFRPWHSGLMLASRGGNRWALLDTVAGTMKVWEPSGEFEWLNECVDAKWSPIGGLCLKGIPDTLGFVLLKNGVDTLAVRYMPHGYNVPPYGYLFFSGNGIVSKGWIYLMNNHGQVSEKPLDVWSANVVHFCDLNYNELVRYDKRIVY